MFYLALPLSFSLFLSLSYSTAYFDEESPILEKPLGQELKVAFGQYPLSDLDLQSHSLSGTDGPATLYVNLEECPAPGKHP